MQILTGQLLKTNSRDEDYGGKGRNCLFLKKNSYNIPETILYKCDEIVNYLKFKIKKFDKMMQEIPLEFDEMRKEEDTKYFNLQLEILNIPPPENWYFEIEKIKKFLGSKIIVRSSMSVEDSKLSSFAGCFDSFHIKNYDEHSLWNEIKKVLASALTKASVKRIIEVTPHFSKLKLGFFIQKYIEPEIHGVCFSRNPLDIWEQNGICEYAFAGNSVVQGTGTSFTISSAEQPHSKLTSFWYEVWQHAFTLEKKFKAAIDYEWVWDGHEFWIVQVRKIVTEDAFMFEKTFDGNIWSRELTLERFPEPLTPLAWSSISDIFVTNVRVLNKQFGILVKNIDQIAISFGGFVYANPNIFSYPREINIRWSHFFSLFKSSLWKILYIFFSFIIRLLFVKDKKFEISFFKLQIILILIEKNFNNEVKKWDYNRDEFLKNIKKFNELKNYNSLNENTKILEKMEKLKLIGEKFLASDFSIFLMKDVLEKILSKIFQNLGFSADEYLSYLGNFSNRTLKFNEECRELFSKIIKDNYGLFFLNSLSGVKDIEEFSKLFDLLSIQSKNYWNEFLSRNGHVRTSWDFIKPCLNEAPWELGKILAQYLSNTALFPKCENKMDYFIKKLDAMLIKINRIKTNNIILSSMDKLKSLMQMDEEQHFLSGLIIQQSKYLFKKAEDLLIAKKILLMKDSIYFLRIEELKEQLFFPTSNLHYLTLKRKNLWIANLSIKKPMQIPILYGNRDDFGSVNTEENIFYGAPMSPGEAQGEVYFAEDLSDIGNVPKGAILLTTSPNPTFTAIYPMLSGIVTLTGGVLSHGFIAAREYGLPAISAPQQIFQILKKGMTVKMNGRLGRLEILS